MDKGHFGIGVYGLRKAVNLGTLWRSAYCLGASHIFLIGGKYSHQCSDTPKSWQHIPLFRYADLDAFLEARPYRSQLVGVEITDRSQSLRLFRHPHIAQYILGPENGSLPNELLDQCGSIVSVDTNVCLNVSTMGAIVAYDRIAKISS